VDALGTATLVDDIPAECAVTASVSRDRIADILSTDGVPELRLDLTSADGSEQATVRIEWSRDELERLLASSPEDDVTLTFDANELVNVFDDVEAHGLRMRAAIFAVAAVGTLGAGASAANAAGQGGTASAGDAAAALQVRSEAMDQAYGLESVASLASGDHGMTRDDALLGGVLLLTVAGATFGVRGTGPLRPA
jgi:hypothetical protein